MAGFRPRELDVTTPSVARMYDYLLGGTHNYPIDRLKVQEVLDVVPFIREAARDNRRFLKRVVEYCMDAGIRQFVDIGSGIPTVGNVHEIAHGIDPMARIVYVDNDREAVVTAHEILDTIDTATVIEADMHNASSILEHPDTRALIDFTQPVALLMVAVLHFVSDKKAHHLVRTYTEHLPPGSYLAISHGALEGQEQWQHLYDNTSNPVILRNIKDVTAFFESFDMLPPGVVMAPDWPHPQKRQQDSTQFGNWAGVGLKP